MAARPFFEIRKERFIVSKHTPGPWNVDGGTNNKGDLYIWQTGEYYGGHAIATVHGEIQEGAEANARLIAAAPDLLATCKASAKQFRKLSNGAIAAEIEAAIKKATT